jgi:hypothetical protein
MILNRTTEPDISIPDTVSFKEVEETILKNNTSLYAE